ncbi:PEP-CTERM sorting domain-containing protein [Phragmitibacter flavus]|uniref:PEP-CTERM sorting domain-containing protein n=1 Tax=Phragmitibacter flavus TaxID=2576071 RepID=A0A5R8K7P7_9BACT|nr:PEP-CTERM sorting domain-containing protein [Phragmitibacter flavus]TLD68360.1 PEP-CTERM sorting domain-containing protein [Phragmitibacter flavus]
MKTILITTMLLALLCKSQAAVIAYDDFDYAPGQPISGLSGGSGFITNWGVRGGGTTVTSTAGITVSPTSSHYATRSFNTLTTGTYYFSFLVDNTNDGSRFTAFSLIYNSNVAGNPTGGSELTYIGQANNQSTWGIHSAGTQVNSPDYPASDRASRPSIAPTLMVLKVEFNHNLDGNERLSLYINPTLSDAEPTTPHIVVSNASFANGITGIWAGSGFENTTGQTTVITTYDNIRITDTWASLNAIPEPTRPLLLLTALTLTLTRRQRL